MSMSASETHVKSAAPPASEELLPYARMKSNRGNKS